MEKYTFREFMIIILIFFILMYGIGYIVVYGQGGIPLILVTICLSFIFYILLFDFFYKFVRNKDRENPNSLVATIEEKKKIYFSSLFLSFFLFEFILFSSLVFSEDKTHVGKVFSKNVGIDKFGHKSYVTISLDEESNFYFGLCYPNSPEIFINQNIFLYYNDTIFGVRFIKGYKRDSDEGKLLIVGCNIFN